MSRRRVVVVGAGVTGLVAARELARDDRCHVTVLERGAKVGGQLAAIPVPSTHGGEVLVDVGAESVHLGAPHVAALVRELGLADDLIEAAAGASLLKVGRRLVPLPAGVGPTGPTQVMPVLKSGVLSPWGLARAGMEPLFTRKFAGDISVGAFITHRFGREVAEKFVDPLLGNLHSGNIHGLSLKATAPQLVPVARDGISLLTRALQKKPAVSTGAAAAPKLPMFASWPQGLTRLTDTLAADSHAELRTGVEVTHLERSEQRWLVHTSHGILEADDVLLTTPTTVSSVLVAEHCPEAASALDWVRTATVATVVLGFDRKAAQRTAVLRNHNGLLLSSRQAVTLKAMTNLSRKWPSRFAQAQHHIVRVSVGSAQRSTVDTLDDQSMIERCVAELAELTGLRAAPQFSQVVRWQQAMPQLAPGHLDRVAQAREALAAVPGLHLAGGPVDGLGIGNTVAAGQRAAATISTSWDE